MNKRRFVRTILLPLLAGLAATLVVYTLTAQEKRAVVGVMTQVVVAAKPIPAKTVISPDMIAVQAIPEQYVTGAAIRRKEEAVGKTTTVPLAEGEIILESNLAQDRRGSAMAFWIPAGTRAVTVAVNEIIGVAGFIQPGDRVDVMVTFPRQLAGIDKTRLILEDIPVLAVTRQTEADGDKFKDFKSFTSVTLAVTPQQGLVLALAEERGSLRLMLRPAGEGGRVGELEVKFDVFGRPGG